MTPSTPDVPDEKQAWQQAVDATSHYLLTHGVQYHQALEYFRRSLLNVASEVAGSKYKAAALAGVSRTLYYNKRGPFGEK